MTFTAPSTLFASRLRKRDYYRWVFDHKPGWQRNY